ncbi:hypothetical protein BEL04_12600 [Mucilaginibacter sp. PPCGB 2223]|uniref:sigma factor-like helix-turn-helix DNA-binding protein n=1 Tax=Mucilaginibacter sp. PPCGB 2223 TaxID=1886027 RepID=UPI000824F3A7|nr:hypothetical protein BEL04_12600 [Mucilaginibacter sp. PPCGB 2223]
MLNNERGLKTKTVSIQSLYESYGAMLLGYIIAIVKDKELAENYLVKVFGCIAARFAHIEWDESSAWHQLRRLASQELSAFTDTVKACGYYGGQPDATLTGNKYVSRMTDEQRQVFCNIYYHQYTVAQLALGLDKTEAAVNKILKEAFTIIKQSHEY